MVIISCVNYHLLLLHRITITIIALITNNTQVIKMLRFTKTDRKAELEGIETLYDDGQGNTLGLTIARSDNNPHYESKLQKLMQPHKKKMEKGKSIPNEVAKRIMNQVIAEEILLGWDETVLLEDDGSNCKYSPESALELLENDGDLRDFVIDFSGAQDNFLTPKK